MQFVLTPDQMRKADACAIEKHFIPSLVLMENAARSAAEIIIEIFAENEMLYPSVTILCGSGNNGGDGFAVARHLFELCDIKILWVGSTDKMSAETEVNFRSVKSLGIPCKHIRESDDLQESDLNADCIIDALIGVGGSENIKGVAQYILSALRDFHSLKIAIDSPTGLNTETGFSNHDCFSADHTITMFAVKTGMLLNDGSDVCGKIHTAYLGAPEFIVEEIAKINVLERDDIDLFFPERKKRTSKFDYGRVLVVAGSRQYPGAAALTANSTIIAGAGLVQLYSTCFHPSILPEVIQKQMPETADGTIAESALETILGDAEKADAIVIGPGLSDSAETQNLVKSILEKIPADLPVLIDADGLRVINKEMKLKRNIVLTPHAGEFSRITGIERNEIEKNSFKYATELAEQLNCTILLKGVPSIITDGVHSYFNINGNPGMATGGSGDVLSGVIGSLLAQGLDVLEACAVGAFLHADAGDRYAEQFGEQTLTASVLIDYLTLSFSNSD